MKFLLVIPSLNILKTENATLLNTARYPFISIGKCFSITDKQKTYSLTSSYFYISMLYFLTIL